MSAPTFALLAGLAYTALGFLGFVPSMVIDERLLGLFPMNGVLSVLHLVIGFWGLFSWSGATSSVNYARALAAICGALAALGIYATANVPLALVPVRGHDIWLHGLSALLGAYFGFRSAARRERRIERRSARNRRAAVRPVALERRTGRPDRRGAGFSDRATAS